jgi:CzcA family heavy metal efflux pump
MNLIKLALKLRLLVLIASIFVAGGGLWAVLNSPIDAFPKIGNVQVQIVSQWLGKAPSEVETQVTYPIELAMRGVSNVTTIRSTTVFGLSLVNVVFKDGTNINLARQQVAENLAITQLPAGVLPIMAPTTSGMGDPIQYNIVGSNDLMLTRDIQDWVVKPQLITVDGVAGVNSFGGTTKQYQVLVDPNKLVRYRVNIIQVLNAVANNNLNTGANLLSTGPEAIAIRGVGIIQNTDDIGSIIVTSRNGIPVYVRDVATVQIGGAYKVGTVLLNGTEVTSAMITTRAGENTLKVIDGVKLKLAQINKQLPNGIKAEVFYDQSELIHKAVHKVTSALIEGAILVILVLFLFLGNLRSAVIVAITLPLSILLSFIIMNMMGMSSNLMSLSGLAIGIGMMVDASIVMVENINRHIGENLHKGGSMSVMQIVSAATKEVARPIIFAIAIIMIVFLPIFSFSGMEGKMFKPLAISITLALGSSLLLALTLVPVLSSLLLTLNDEEKENKLVNWLEAKYKPILAWGLDNTKSILICATVALFASFSLFFFMGSEFIPRIDEETTLVRLTLPPSMSIEESAVIGKKASDLIKTIPEVDRVVDRMGRADLGADPMASGDHDIFVITKPKKQWRKGMTNDKINEEIARLLEPIPAKYLEFSQPIEDRVNEMLTGVKSQVAIKLYGDDFSVLEENGKRIVSILSKTKGVVDIKMPTLSGFNQLEIRLNRQAIAKHGINIADAQAIIETSISGKEATVVLDGQKRYSLIVKLPNEYRNSVEAFKHILVPDAMGNGIPLGQIADFVMVDTVPVISRENGQRFIAIQFNVRGSDVTSAVNAAMKDIDKIKLPLGYHIDVGGQFENQKRATATLLVAIPIALFLITVLLYMTFNSLKFAGLILLNVPFAMMGGIIAMFISGQYLSVPASVGFIALFGIAMQNGIILMSYLKQLRESGMGVDEAITTSCHLRLRPVLMTALVGSLGIVPLLLATGTGSEVSRPLATVVVGGLISSTILTLLLLPVVYKWVEEKWGDRIK